MSAATETVNSESPLLKFNAIFVRPSGEASSSAGSTFRTRVDAHLGITRVAWTSRLNFENSALALFPRQMNRISFILVTDKFEDIRVQQQMHLLRRCGPRFLVCRRIVDRGVEFEVAEIHATKSFGNVERFGRGMTH